MYLLTTPAGADLPAGASLEGFPVLVRLHKDFFDFSAARPNGEDLRFSSSTGQPLAYQIESWDAAGGIASIWVRIPYIQGNSRQELKLHWGKSDAASESSGKAVFNASNGYLSVWHMHDAVQDEVGTLVSTDTGTTATAGTIGGARRFPPGKGIFCGDKNPNYPSGAAPHSTEAWIRAEQPNGRVVAWGNEQAQGKVVMHHRSPPHISMDCYFSDANVSGTANVPLSQWSQVVHTYQKGESRLYVNGVLDGVTKRDGNALNVRSPARLWIGGWYHHYDFVGDIDEVRISQVTRSADWIKLQYENQKPQQTLVGPLVQPGLEFSVWRSELAVKEGSSATVTAQAGGAQKLYWILNRDGRESVVATDRFSYTFAAGRVVGDQKLTLQFKAIYPDEIKTRDIALTVQESIPEPVFTLPAPPSWDGRRTIEIVPQLTNREAMQAQGAGQLKFNWTIDGVATTKQIAAGKLVLQRAQGSGPMRVSVAIDNGGSAIVQSATIAVQEPPPSEDAWVPRPLTASEQPEDNQFYACDRPHGGPHEGTLAYAGTLAEPADSVFVRVYADDKLYQTAVGKLSPQRAYSLSVKLRPGLVKYRTEFGATTGDRETVLHAASNLVCGDVYLINGQSNAVATDIGPEDPTFTSEWIRSYGSTSGDPQRARLKRWAGAVARDRNGGMAQIGYWGMELARRLVESQKIPICIINGAVGGTRIDQHQRNPDDPTAADTIYGRLLWRVQEAKLTHGVRGILWHQGENDQGADGPTGGYGWETYRQFFVDLTAAWKEDFPNIERYYVFQIWPKACAMGVNDSDNKLRDVQRTLPSLFSNLSVMSTLGIKPPGGCHFPKEGYAEFARLICPLLETQIYHRTLAGPATPPNLRRAIFSSDKRDELILEFDQSVAWSEGLTTQFYLDGAARQIAAGSATGNRLTLKLNAPSQASKVNYLDSAAWSPNNLLYGQNGIAALTFCDVPIETAKPRR